MKITKTFLISQYTKLGKSGYKISKELGVPKYVIYNTIKKYNIKMRSLRASRQPKNSKKLSGYKWCPKCKTDKEFSEFHKHKRSWHGVCVYCKECASEIAPKYYIGKNKERQKTKAKLVLEFGNKCKECGLENLPIAAFSFHHHTEKMSDPNYKRITWVINSRNSEFINSEKIKWIMLCANCHNIKHSICKLTATQFGLSNHL